MSSDVGEEALDAAVGKMGMVKKGHEMLTQTSRGVSTEVGLVAWLQQDGLVGDAAKPAEHLQWVS